MEVGSGNACHIEQMLHSFGKACRTARMLKSGSRVRGVVGSWNYWGGTAGLQQLPWGLYATGLKDSACFPHHARPTQ